MRRPASMLTAVALLVVACTSASAASRPRLTLDPSKDYGNRYADGLLPVGDGKYKVDVAAKGYFDACQQYAASLSNGGGGAMTRGPWFTDNNTEYDVNKKVHVEGSVNWDSSHHVTLSGSTRTVTTNDLPSHPTGTFPIRSSDPAYEYDRNPNSIGTQHISITLPATPAYGSPHCGGGQVGVMNTGVLLFNALDAGGRDAGAWEVQDDCGGHPQRSGEYHYHTLSGCITRVSVHHVIGWALDGYPITGPTVGTDNILTTRDLDVCHGITSKVRINGRSVTTYHYVMTQDYPYSIGCFRAAPVTTNPL